MEAPVVSPNPSIPPLAGGWNPWTWVPIRPMAARHRPRILAHLQSLEPHDRYLRFGYPATDEQISKYVDTIDFELDEVFGIFNRRLEIIAMAHLASLPTPGKSEPSLAEFGVSVLAKARGRGYGARLFERAMLLARNRGVDTLFIHALSENIAMLKIARKAGATVVRDGSEAEARLRLPPETFVTRFGELVEEQAAEIDYRLKAQAWRVNEIFGIISEVKTHITHAGGSASGSLEH